MQLHHRLDSCKVFCLCRFYQERAVTPEQTATCAHTLPEEKGWSCTKPSPKRPIWAQDFCCHGVLTMVFMAKFPWAALSSSPEQPFAQSVMVWSGMCSLCTLRTCQEQRSPPRRHQAWSPMFGTPRTDGHQSHLDKTHDCRLNSCSQKKNFRNSFYWLDEQIKYSSKSSFFFSPQMHLYNYLTSRKIYLYFFKSLKFTFYL